MIPPLPPPLSVCILLGVKNGHLHQSQYEIQSLGAFVKWPCGSLCLVKWTVSRRAREWLHTHTQSITAFRASAPEGGEAEGGDEEAHLAGAGSPHGEPHPRKQPQTLGLFKKQDRKGLGLRVVHFGASLFIYLF